MNYYAVNYNDIFVGFTNHRIIAFYASKTLIIRFGKRMERSLSNKAERLGTVKIKHFVSPSSNLIFLLYPYPAKKASGIFAVRSFFNSKLDQ
jgi:hypothetical protein